MDSQYCEEDWYNGSIMSITLENFMCHSNFHLTFNPRINFISGLNGSGKSAIQTAFVVGFGARASTTNRGNSLKTLIKYGCSSASISITIANNGIGHYTPSPYRPEVYGKKITIVRQITQSGGNPYKFLNENGKIVKGLKNELKKIILHFNILIDNPICVMNQAMVKTFHKSANPEDKYDLFYKSISANVYNDRIEETKLVSKEHLENLLNMEKVLEQYRKEVSDYETYENKSKQLEELKIIKSNCENEYAWLVVSKHEKSREDCFKEIYMFQNNMLQAKNLSEVLKENIDICTKELETKKKELTNIEECRSRNHLNLMETKKNLDFIMKEYDTLKHILRKHDTSLKCLISDRKDLEKYVEVEHKKGNTNTLAQYKEMLTQYEQTISEVEAAWKTNMEHEQSLINTIDDLKQKIGNLKNSEITPLQRSIFEVNRSVNSMSQQQDRINFYGNWMPLLVKSIDAAFKQNKFMKKPIGPIGEYIKVNDNKWIFSIENHIGRGTLRTFLVDNFSDNKILQSIMDKIIPVSIKKPTIITSKFFENVHNISSRETSNSMFSMLTFTNPVVANCLIDNNRIETIMLVDNKLEAMTLMENLSTVPKCCHFSLTLDGTQVYPSPSYRVYSLQNPSEPVLLQSDVSVAVYNLKQEKKTLEMKINHLNNEFENAEKLKLDKQQLLQKTQSETRSLKAKYDEYFKQINALKAKCDEEKNDRIAALTEEMNEVDSKIAQIEKLKKEYLDPVKKYEGDIKILNDKIRDIKSTIDKTDRSAIYEQIESFQTQIDKNNADLAQITNNMVQDKQTLINLEKKLENEKKQLKEVLKCAELMCDKINVTRSENDIWRDIEKVDQKHKLLEMELNKKGNNYFELRNEYKRKKQEYITQHALYKQIEDIYKNNIKFIKHSTIALKNYIQALSIKVIEAFDVVMELRKINGRLEIDQNKQNMVISMFDSISTSCASGGERTFATVALILALWSNMELPFYSIDEYDVYMDNVNRLATTNLLMMIIGRRKNQFIFLTPQDISHVKSAHNIKIVKLKEPRT